MRSHLASAQLKGPGNRSPFRSRVFDSAGRIGLTFDTANNPFNADATGNMRGKVFDFTCRSFDGKLYDSSGAFLVGELERLDPTMNLPLAAVSWARDVPMRKDVTVADDVASFTLSNFGSNGSLGTGQGVGNGKAWVGKNTTQVASVSVDISKTPQALHEWALELFFSIFELEAAARLGRPIDQQKFENLQLKHQMDIDEAVYYGDLTLPAFTGLINAGAVTNVGNVVNGGSGTAWSTKTPNQILTDVNTLLASIWLASGYAQIPDSLLLPPTQFSYISTQLISTAGTTSILKYLLENNILTASQNKKLRIEPLKWMTGAGAGGTIFTDNANHNRMAAYTADRKYVQYPMTALQRTPVQYDGLYHKTTYYCRLGHIEVRYPETFGYADGIG